MIFTTYHKQNDGVFFFEREKNRYMFIYINRTYRVLSYNLNTHTYIYRCTSSQYAVNTSKARASAKLRPRHPIIHPISWLSFRARSKDLRFMAYDLSSSLRSASTRPKIETHVFIYRHIMLTAVIKIWTGLLQRLRNSFKLSESIDFIH